MQTQNIHEGKQGAHVTIEKYEAVREAILAALPLSGEGLTWDELLSRVATKVPVEQFPHLGSVSRYSKAVQLDLEARGLIERVPKSKLMRLRLAARS